MVGKVSQEVHYAASIRYDIPKDYSPVQEIVAAEEEVTYGSFDTTTPVLTPTVHSDGEYTVLYERDGIRPFSASTASVARGLAGSARGDDDIGELRVSYHSRKGNSE